VTGSPENSTLGCMDTSGVRIVALCYRDAMWSVREPNFMGQ
jgi:hypothetical protein